MANNEMIFWANPLSEGALNTALGITVTDYNLTGNVVTFSNAGYTIPNNAFNENVDLLHIKMSSANTGQSGFSGCEVLITAFYPIATICNYDTFNYCYTLTTFTAPYLTKLDSGIFYYCTSLITIDALNVTEIDNSGIFESCTSLANITFPAVTQAGDFDGCTALAKVSFPSLITLHSYTFEGCANLVSFRAPLVEYIYGGAFSGCNNLTEIYIPVCTYIDSNAFTVTGKQIVLTIPPELLNNSAIQWLIANNTVLVRYPKQSPFPKFYKP